MSEDLLYLTATEALKRFADRTLSPVELLDAQIARAETTADSINAFTYTHFDEARDAARASEARWAKGAPMGCLDGLTVAVKDESYIEGQKTSHGSLLHENDPPASFTSPNNTRILNEGAIVHARTATPEFSAAVVCWSRLWGVTRNPWNADYTPGGSSGGASAALAAGTTTLATGSDIGGSIRVPASCAGVLGFKPPYGRNPDDIPFNYDFYCHTGPLARSTQDLILLQNVMCGPHPHDAASLYPKLTLPTSYPDIKGWKIALSMDLGSYTVREDVRRNTLAAAEILRSLGAEVEEVDIGWGPEVPQACFNYLGHLFGGALSEALPEHADKLTSYVRKVAEDATISTGADFVATLQVAGESYMKLGPLLDRYDCLICPTTAIPAAPAAFDSAAEKLVIEGVEMESAMGWVLTPPFNMHSRCPVISVPTGFGTEGVPTGMQIVAPTYRDATAFQLATAYEAATGGWYNTADSRPRL
ncbi:amidase [Chachezhania sediminis]|uniref:amidase n=1 Tax=Chachezhania sediminis TaxID=2599291 RepID=UPI00131BFB29|nr:amidase [Chachezhania sediminis]